MISEHLTLPVVRDSAEYTTERPPLFEHMGSARDLTPDMLEVIRDIKRVLDAQYSSMSRPRMIPLDNSSPWTTHVRYRVSSILLSSATAYTLVLEVGAERVLTIFVGGNNPVALPISLTIDRGQNVRVRNITTPAATDWSASLIAVEAD